MLKWNEKQKTLEGSPKDNLPRLVCVSGRVREAIDKILDDLKNRQLDIEFVRLYQQIFSKNIKGHLYRGFSIISQNGELLRSWKDYCGKPTPICLHFTDFSDSHLTRIGKELSVIPLFAKTIQKFECFNNFLQ